MISSLIFNILIYLCILAHLIPVFHFFLWFWVIQKEDWNHRYFFCSSPPIKINRSCYFNEVFRSRCMFRRGRQHKNYGCTLIQVICSPQGIIDLFAYQDHVHFPFCLDTDEETGMNSWKHYFVDLVHITYVCKKRLHSWHGSKW